MTTHPQSSFPAPDTVPGAALGPASGPAAPFGMPPTVYGILCMVVGMVILTANDGIAKYLTESYPVGQVLALRGSVVVLVVIAWGLSSGRRATFFTVVDWRLQMARAVLMSASTFAFVTGLSLLPIADIIAISFAGPILTAAFAVPLLGERIGWRRWSAILVGFGGVVVMVRPTPEAFQIAALVPLCAALMGALRDVVTRRLSRTDTTRSILLVSTATVTTAGFATALAGGWQPVAPPHVALFLVSGLCVGFAQALTIEAFRWGEASIIAPFKYTSLVWAVIIGALVWGDVPGLAVALGSAIVVASGLYILHRERLNRPN